LCGNDNPKFAKALRDYLDKQKKLLLEESDEDYYSEEEADEVANEGPQPHGSDDEAAQPAQDGEVTEQKQQHRKVRRR